MDRYIFAQPCQQEKRACSRITRQLSRSGRDSLPADHPVADVDLVMEILEKIEAEESVMELPDTGAGQYADLQGGLAATSDSDRIDLRDTELGHAAVGEPHR